MARLRVPWQALWTVLAVTLLVLSATGAFAVPELGAAQPSRDRSWLVTTDGVRIEIRGPWRIKGQRVLYTNDRGTLSSIRLSALDLEATERATAEKRPRTAPQPKASAPALVLSDRDFSKWKAALPEASDVASEPASGASPPDRSPASPVSPVSSPPSRPAAADGTESSSATSPVEVASWQDVGDSDSGIQLFATLRNTSNVRVFKVQVTVRVLDEAGNVLESKSGQLRLPTIGAGESVNLRANFPDVTTYSEIEFEISSEQVRA